MTSPIHVIRTHVSKDHSVLSPLWTLFERARHAIVVNEQSGITSEHLIEQVRVLDDGRVATVSEYPYLVIANALLRYAGKQHPRLVFNSPYTLTVGHMMSIHGLRPIRVNEELPTEYSRITVYGTHPDQFDIKVEYYSDSSHSASNTLSNERLA